MNICLYSVVKNEATLMPYFLRHYAGFVDHIVIYDAQSTDDTPQIVKSCPVAELRSFDAAAEFDDHSFIEFANEQYKEVRGRADWVIWVDADEFLYHPNIRGLLQMYMEASVTLPLTQGFSMIGDSVPKLNGQIYDEIPWGIRDEAYSKPCIFNPEIDINYDLGKHVCRPSGRVVRSRSAHLQLLHYRALSRDYLEVRSAGNYERMSARNKSKGLGFHTYPEWKGTYSAEWYVTYALPNRANVIQPQTFSRVTDALHQGANPYQDFPQQQWPTDCQGWDSEHHWFHDMIHELLPHIIVEVGTYKGASALHFARALKERRLDAVVICVDTWLGDHTHWLLPENRPSLKIRFGRPEIYNTFLSNVVAAELQQYVVPLPMDSASGCEYLKAHRIGADLIYIDGCHEEGQVYCDLRKYYDGILLPGGVMLIDDYDPPASQFHGLMRDIHRFCRERNLQLATSGRKAMIRKPIKAPEVVLPTVVIG